MVYFKPFEDSRQPPTAVPHALRATGGSTNSPCLQILQCVVAVSAKMIATVFLLLYFAVVSHLAVILASAAGDLLMGVLLWVLLRRVDAAVPPSSTG